MTIHFKTDPSNSTNPYHPILHLQIMSVLFIPPSTGCGPEGKGTDANGFLILYILRNGRRIGRGMIGKEIGLGEGSTRRLIDMMSSLDLLKVEQTGVTITKYGKALLDRLAIEIVHPRTDRYVLGTSTCGALIRGKGPSVTNGTAQRNAAIRVGGEGCTTWFMRDGEIIMAPDWNVDSKDPSFGIELRRATGMSEGDALVIAGADTPEKARDVAISVALDMI